MPRRFERTGGPVAPRREPGPALPDDVTGQELDRQVRAELTSLARETARTVSRHLVMVGELLDEAPDAAWEHADAARRLAGRIGIVREAAGLAAYRSGRYADALSELRAARRLTGSLVHLPVMADTERGLGRPERALALASSPEARQLDRAGQVEMLIVAAGARADLGEPDAAVVTLQIPQLHERVHETWLARLRSAYADALAAVGRLDDSRHWLQLAAEVDDEGATGAAERLAGLDGINFVDLMEDADDVLDTAEVAADLSEGDGEVTTGDGGDRDGGDRGDADSCGDPGRRP